MRQSLVSFVVALILKGHVGAVINGLCRRVYSDQLAFGLRCDLTIPFEPPPAKFPLAVRPQRDDDISVLLDTNAPDITSEEVYVRLRRLKLLRARIPTCFVGVDARNRPCYMQWLISACDNDKIQSHLPGFPQLAPDEALLEGAFTPEAYRGQGIMPCAMAQIAKKAEEMGARWVITFVDHANIPSLKGCKRAGFLPYLQRQERRRFLSNRVTFMPLPAGTPYPFEREPGSTSSG